MNCGDTQAQLEQGALSRGPGKLKARPVTPCTFIAGRYREPVTAHRQSPS